MNPIDHKWIAALKPYWGGGTVPFWAQKDGSVDAAKTIDWMMEARGQHKIGPNGEELPLVGPNVGKPHTS